jgi:hypothetical protein
MLHHSVTSFIGCLTSDDCTGNLVRCINETRLRAEEPAAGSEQI